MEKEILKEPMYLEEIVSIIRGGFTDAELYEKLQDYHDNDIAQTFPVLTKEERTKLYNILGAESINT